MGRHHRKRSRRDPNQGEIVEALRAAGASVEELDDVGAGVPDLLVGFRGRNFLLEVKSPPYKGPKGGRLPEGARAHQYELNDRQKKWHEAWSGQVAVVNSIDQALEAVGAESVPCECYRCGTPGTYYCDGCLDSTFNRDGVEDKYQ